MRLGRRSLVSAQERRSKTSLSIRIPTFASTWTGWWILRREEIRNLPFAGPARAYACSCELQRESHAVSYQTVAELLREMDYSLQANQKKLEGSQHADRNQQFEYINRKAQRYLRQSEPVISVHTKKKELVGDFKNPGREWHPQGKPEQVRVHYFEIRQPENGKVAPYGVYYLGRNAGWVSVGVDHDTAEFAVESIRRWWRWMGRRSYLQAKRLLITADSGGSNGARVRLWKWELRQLADETGLEISVCHFPPGTSKWNKIEHRLFSFISQNWRGKPLISHQVIIDLIAATTTKTGLICPSKIDTNIYEPGLKVSDQQMAGLQLRERSSMATGTINSYPEVNPARQSVVLHPPAEPPNCERQVRRREQVTVRCSSRSIAPRSGKRISTRNWTHP